MRKVITPQRDLFARSVDQIAELPGLALDERDYFRDVYDHLIRISDLIDSYRDLLSGATDMYLSTVSNRQNEVMKQLTVIATIFLPLSFITGFFGMNFGYLVTNLIRSDWTFWVVGVGSMVATCVALRRLLPAQGLDAVLNSYPPTRLGINDRKGYEVIRGETGCSVRCLRSRGAQRARSCARPRWRWRAAVAQSSPSTAGSTTNAAQTSRTDTFAFGTGNDAGTYVEQLLPVIRPWQKAALTFQTDFTRAVSAQDKARVVGVVETFQDRRRHLRRQALKARAAGECPG